MSWTLTYKLTDAQDGYIVTGYSTTSTEPVDEVVIPDNYNGLPVVEIAKYAFFNKPNLIKLTLGANIKVINMEAIKMCHNLADILLNNGLETISRIAIYECDALTSLTIPVSVSTLHSDPFSNCANLSTIYFNAEYARVASDSLYSQIWDTSSSRQLDIIIGNTVKILAQGIFYNTHVNSITFEAPSIVEAIEDYSLNYSSYSNCKTLILPETCLSIGSSSLPAKLDYIKFPDAIEILNIQGISSNFVWKRVILPNSLKAFTQLTYLHYIYESTDILLNTSDDYPGIGYLGSTDNPYLMAVSISDISLETIELHPDTLILAIGGYTPTWKSWLANGTTHSLILNAKLEFISALYDGNTSMSGMFAGDTYTAADIISVYGTKGPKYIAGRRPDGTLNNHCFLESCGYDLPKDWNTGLPSVAIDAECKFLGIGNLVPTIPDSVVQAFFHNGTPDTDIAAYWSPSSQLRFVNGHSWSHSIEEILKRPVTTIPTNLLMAGSFLLTLNINDLILPDSCICFLTDGLLPHIKKLHLGKKVAMLDLSVRTNLGQSYSISKKGSNYWNALQSITCSTENPMYRAEANCLIAKASNKVILGSNSASLPESVNGIAEFAFAGCIDITSINIPEHIKYVERDAFAYCTKLTSVAISKNTSLVCSGLFKFCPSLQTIRIAPDHPIYTDLGCNLIATKANPNILLVGCRSTSLPDTLTTIAAAAFVGSGITSLNLPDSIKTVGNWAFEECKSLTTANLGKVSTISTSMFYNCSALESITMSTACNKIERLGFYNCSNLEQIDLNDSLITSIGAEAFKNCTKLTTVNFPDSLRDLEAYAIFYGCNSLKNLTIPNGVSKCANNTFYSCNLEQVTAPGTILNMLPKNSVKQITVNSESIPDNALANFTNLTSLTLEDTVKSIGNNVLTGCPYITSLTLPSNIESISNNAFTDNTSLQKITFEGNANRLKTIISGTDWFNANTKVYTKEYKKIPVYICKTLQEF